MKLETFFEKFCLLAETPDAVARMRELVLQLAEQGKLVDQDPAEGNGHSLLNEIHRKNAPAKADDEVEAIEAALPHVPPSWASSKLGVVAEIVRGVSFPGSAKSETRSEGDVACLRTASVQSEIDWDDLIFISPSHVSRDDQWVATNDIMISMANSYALVGKVAIVRNVPQKATFGAFLAAIRPVLIEPYFLLYVLRSPRMQAAFRESSSQTTNIANISLGRMRPLPFPLPPLAEQKRIVAKVDELMALCDQLEDQQKERETRKSALVRASLSRFAATPTPANLDFLFHNSYDISPAELRKSILTLAFQGRLIPQRPEDEPASKLLVEIVRQKSNTSRRRNAGHSEAVAEREKPYTLPNSWIWTKLGNIADWGSGSTPARGNHEFYGGTISWLKSGELNDNRSLTGSEEQVTELALKKCSFRHNLPGDVLFAMYGATVGKVAILAGPAVTNQAVCGCTPCFGVLNQYLFFYLLSQRQCFRNASEGGAQPNFSKDKILAYPFPLPPLAEQRRIVTKVDQLMALVDELERQLETSRSTASKLLDAVIHELTKSAGELPQPHSHIRA